MATAYALSYSDWFLHLVKILPRHFLTAVVAFIVIRLVEKVVTWFFTPLNLIPGPEESIWLGSLPVIKKEAFMVPHRRWWKEASGPDNKEVKMIHYTTGAFGRQCVVVLDKLLVKRVLTAPCSKKKCRFNKKMPFISNILGDGLVALEGVDWHRHRRIIQPSFNSSFIKRALNKAVPPKVNMLVQLWKKAPAREIDVASHMSALTLDIIGQVGFSHDFDGMDLISKWAEDKDSEGLAELQDELILAISRAMKPSVLTIALIFSGMAKLDVYVNPKSRRVRNMLNCKVDKIVQNAKKMDECSSDDSKQSLLQLMLKAKDTDPTTKGGAKTLSDVELRDETKTFLVAGHETTSTWCYWAIYALSLYPDIQQKLYDNVVKYAKRSETITWDMVNDMEYLDVFMKEVLRLFPPVGMIVRTSAVNEAFDGYEIPMNTRLVIPIHLLHRHVDYWDDPETFSPERWLKPTPEFEERIRFAFLPFSSGGRNCIGQQFATIEAKLIMAPLVREFQFQVAPSQRETEFTFTNFITMKSKPLLKVVTKKR